MAEISKLSRLVAGLQRQVDLAVNTLVVQDVKVGGASGTILSKVILDKLISLQNGTDFANGTDSHTHDGRYFTETELGSSTASSGSDLIGDDNTYSNFTPTAATVKGALAGIDSVLATGSGRVKISATDTTSEFLNASITAGAGLSKAISNSGANEQLDIYVNVDNSTLEIDTDALRIKDSGVTNSKINDGAVNNAKIASGIDAAKIADGSVSNTEFQYLGGVTSDVQTQINSKAADNAVIKKDGSVAFTAAQSMGSNKLTSLADGTAANDAVNKGQLDNGLALKLNKAGDTMSGNLAMSNNSITGLASPTAGTDAANKNYVDASIAGLSWKNRVRVASTVNVDVSSAPSSIDGVTLAANDRVLLKNQTAGAENGIYIFNGSGSALSRAEDANSDSELVSAAVYVSAGSTNPDTAWVQTVDAVTLGTTALVFTQFAGASTVQAGIGLSYSGATLNVNLGAGIAQLPTDEVGVDVHSAGGLFTTEDNSSSSTASGAQLAIKLNGSTLSKSSSGLQIATGGITNTEINSSAAIAYSKLNIADGDLTIAKTSGLQSALDSKVDENAPITGATKTKITYDSKGLVTAGADATTADIADSSNKRYVTDADLVDIGNLSGVNTGDQTITLTGDVTGTGTGSFAATISAGSVNENKINSSALDATLTGGSGQKLSVASSPRGLKSMVAGEAMAANTSFLVRFAISGETAGRVYKADKDASTLDKFYAIGLALKTAAVSSGDTVDITFEGTHTLGSSDSPFSAGDIGKAVYLTAAGAFSIIAPTGTNEAVWRVGIVEATNKIWIGTMQLNGIN